MRKTPALGWRRKREEEEAWRGWPRINRRRRWSVLTCKFAEVGLWGWRDLHGHLRLDLEPRDTPKAGVTATT